MADELTPPEIREETVKLALKIASICEENAIHWFAFYGTLLGAVRHQGFIPWDDEFDIAMLRQDFDRFVEYCRRHEEELLADGYRLIDKDSAADYPYNIPRFCNIHFRMVTPEYPSAGMGVFVDLYPLDSVGDDPDVAEKRIAWKKKLFTICAASASLHKPIETRGGVVQKLLKAALYLYAKDKEPRFFFKRFDRLAQMFPQGGKYVSCVVWEMDFCAYPKAWFEDLIDAPFEDITVKIPRAYDSVLRAYYGDYTRLPPKEERVPTHDYKLYRLI